MYTRSYYPGEDNNATLPDNYDGTAFAEGIAEADEEEKTTEVGSIPLLGGLGLPFLDGLKMPKIGTEELLIIAVAAFLLFSKDGDRECAMILLFLLFIN